MRLLSLIWIYNSRNYVGVLAPYTVTMNNFISCILTIYYKKRMYSQANTPTIERRQNIKTSVCKSY